MEFLDSNYPGLQRVLYQSENLSVKYYEQKLCRKFVFSGQHWTELSIKKCKNSVFGVLRKISVSVLNFSSESAKKLTIYPIHAHSYISAKSSSRFCREHPTTIFIP